MARWYPMWVVSLLFAFTVVASPPAQAQTQVWLLGANVDPRTSSESMALSCAQPDSVQRFYVYVRSDVALSQIQAIEFYLDIYSSQQWWYCGNDPPPPLPPFWVFASPEASCNPDALLPDAEPPPISGGFRDLWNGAHPSASYASAMRTSTHEVYDAIMYTVSSVDLVANRIYYAGELTLSRCAGAVCQGCDAPVVLSLQATVFSSTQYFPLGSDDLIINVIGVCATIPPPDPADFTALASRREHRVVSAAMGSVCDPVPVTKHTWGSLKILYR